MNREVWLEKQLDRDDLSDIEFNTYNKELNDIQHERNIRKIKAEQIRKELLKQEEESRSEEKMSKLTEEEVDKMYREAYEKYAGTINGLSFDEWFKESTSFYEIDENYNMISKARSANTQEIVPHISKAHAKHSILKRIKYKMYDHEVRGHDFAWKKEK